MNVTKLLGSNATLPFYIYVGKMTTVSKLIRELSIWLYLLVCPQVLIPYSCSCNLEKGQDALKDYLDTRPLQGHPGRFIVKISVSLKK